MIFPIHWATTENWKKNKTFTYQDWIEIKYKVLFIDCQQSDCSVYKVKHIVLGWKLFFFQVLRDIYIIVSFIVHYIQVFHYVFIAIGQ